jgi:hypothetical protein
MSQVFTATGAFDTPVLNPGWTVQNAATGSNQSLTSNAGPGLNSGTQIGFTPAAAQTALGSAQTDASVTGVSGTDAANLAKLTDLKAIAAKVDALNAALVAAGLEV